MRHTIKATSRRGSRVRPMPMRAPGGRDRVLSRRLVLEETHFEFAAEESTKSKWLYAGYIASFALVDLSALLRLIPDIAAWVHVLLALLLSTSAVVCITMYVRINARVSHYRTSMLRHLMHAHNERATALDVGPL
jgi:hypothetical protein